MKMEAWDEFVDPIDGLLMDDDPIEYSHSSSGIQTISSLVKAHFKYQIK